MQQTEWHIGCSGFSYKEWKDKFYPKGLATGKWFEYYCQHFNCVELNVTFYRFPQVTTLQGWHRRSPEGFRFAAKAPRTITHYKKFKEAHTEVADFYKVLQYGLAEKLGAVLFQTPPSFAFSEENLANIISHLNPEVTNVVEFRHESWWQPEVWEQLQANNIVVSGTSYPGLPDTLPEQQTTAYYRLHGVPHLYHSPYTEPYIRKVAGRVSGAQKAFVFFDNTASGAAIQNAQYLQELVGFKTN
ncbi:Uncharacterized conserved protein YecE, DUF72 family [Cnuella takakiae]|uniref:Uncharacterized conserved protein YecE, DUF72 family n=1 Tax=Cnuella takakiae TaxID=1302690 RepID=A0A1M5A5Y3_9BACT|nr:DUF72 domain-containing protein [Cnuella takakiae]OLY92081.1 hypothetical protein BUE76_09370 [Cnuella takakiae]SHF25739.1 Uncharacterized conserved protein YecE, DUF72 family [Cnuella takakiae]